MTKNSYAYKELDSHIRAFWAYSGHRKTILITHPHLYRVVTRVNYMTLQIWLEYVNAIIATIPTGRFETQMFCWLTEQKQYRRSFQNKLSLDLPV